MGTFRSAPRPGVADVHVKGQSGLSFPDLQLQKPQVHRDVVVLFRVPLPDPQGLPVRPVHPQEFHQLRRQLPPVLSRGRLSQEEQGPHVGASALPGLAGVGGSHADDLSPDRRPLPGGPSRRPARATRRRGLQGGPQGLRPRLIRRLQDEGAQVRDGVGGAAPLEGGKADRGGGPQGQVSQDVDPGLPRCRSP